MSNAVLQQEEDFAAEIARCHDRIHVLQAEVKELEAQLRADDSELEAIQQEKQKYDILAEVCNGLEQLSELGAASMFWEGIIPEEQVPGHLSRIREQADFFDRRVKKITDKHAVIVREIDHKNRDMSLLADDILILKEREEESQNEFVIEREIKELPYRIVVMPWAQEKEDKNRLRKILLITLLFTFLSGLFIPMIDLPIPDRNEPVKVPERLAKMLKKPQPKPKPKPKPIEEKKPKEEKKKPTEEERKKAREKVATKGVLAFKNNLADLLDDMPETKLGAEASLSNAGATARRTQRNILTSQATSGSGGIRTSSLSRDVAGTGDKLAAVGFSRVQSAIGDAVADDRPLSDTPGPSRTDEEIQIVFDRKKAALYRLYQRELRKNPSLQGKVVLRITIEPDGSVSACKVESSDMDSKALLDKMVATVKRFNFGAKDGVPKITILYPIDFLPAS